MNWLNSHRIEVGGSSVSYAALLAAMGTLFVGFLLASAITSRIRGRGDLEAGSTRWRATVGPVVGYVLRLLTVVSALQVAGVNIASLLAAGAVLAVGIGIAMQKVAENFVSGVILLAERTIREGDIIEVEGRIAKVRHIGIRATIALTLDDEEIIVPNGILAQSAVKNLTLTEVVYRLRVRVGVAYATDVDHAARVMGEAAESLEWRDERRPPVVNVSEFGPASIDFEVSVWTRDVWGMRRGQSELRKAIWRALREADIEIPVTQPDVRVDKLGPRSETLAGRPAGGREGPPPPAVP